MIIYFSPEYFGFCFAGLQQKNANVTLETEADGLSRTLGL